MAARDERNSHRIRDQTFGPEMERVCALDVIPAPPPPILLPAIHQATRLFAASL